MTIDNLLIEFLPEIICFGIDALFCGVALVTYSHTEKLIQSITEAPKIDLNDGDLGKLLAHHKSSQTVVNGLKVLPFVVVSGKVVAEDDSKLLLNNTIIKTSAPPVKGVIKETSILEHRKNLSGLGFWYDSVRTINSYTNDIPFWIVPSSKSSLRLARPNAVEVKEFSRASKLDLDVVSDHFNPSPSTLGDQLLGHYMGNKPHGIQTTEKMLVNGASITVIGELVQNQHGKFSIQQPSNGLNYMIIKDSLRVFIEDLQAQSKGLKIVSFLFGGVGIFIIGFGLWRYWKNRENRRQSEENFRRLEQIVVDRPLRTPSVISEHETETVGSNIAESSTCVVCLGEPREVIFLDCGHVCSCASCAMTLMQTNPSCPICRATIVRVSQAFIS